MANILFIVPRTSGGGAEKVITSLASQIAEEDQVWMVTTVREDGQKGYLLSDAVRYVNLYDEIRENPGSALSGLITGLLPGFIRKRLRKARRDAARSAEPGVQSSYSMRVKALREFKQAHQIDCSVSFLNSANYINALADAGERRIISVRSCPAGAYAPADCCTQDGIERLEQACAKADVIVPVSREAGDELREHFSADPAKMRVIYNYVDIEAVRSGARAAAEAADDPADQLIDKADFTFIAVGRLTQKKGQWHLIRAFREVVKAYPGAALIILGKEGKKEENTAGLLEKVIAENGLEKNVMTAGFYENPYRLMGRADAFVMTSFNEGFPNALAEAMALSLPVIAADCSSGPREILAPETDYRKKAAQVEYTPYGILTPLCSGDKLITEPLQKEEQMLAEAMLTLIRDGKLREKYAAGSLERARAFDRKTTLSQWKELIHETTEH